MTSTPPQDLRRIPLESLDLELDKLTLGAGATTHRPHERGQPRFHTILACLDATPASENVVAWAREIAKAHDARVVVASVVPPTAPGIGLSTAYGVATGLEQAYADAEAHLREHAEGAARRLSASGIETDVVVTSGSIASALASVAKTHHADLVILGSHGGGAFTRVALGSAANAILDRVEASVLVVRTSPPHRQILAATDGSSASYRAVAYAIRQAELARADLVVQHVIEYPEGTDQVPSGGYLRDVIARMQLKHLPHISYQLDAGRPAARILAKAEEVGADLIVVGSRGLGNVAGFFLGSVSHKLVNTAPVSVLVVKDAHHER